MRRVILFVAVLCLAWGIAAGTSSAEQLRENTGEMTKQEFCQEAGPNSMQECEKAYRDLQRRNIGIPNWVKPVLKECGFLVVKEILELGCIETCVDTLGATCVLCVFGGEFVYEQSVKCQKAVCKAAGGENYHLEGGECVKK